ncbi:histidine phosphatase family protein [Shewanella youngdeokensis]|uniref:Histidine phosphatase family protein n=1 Tax=Shewanella youngdeokensis TaxID=2999068 RepID=A0ABZ0JZQ1_9GAMM|nr:histidine phosphatase family protein [Shewanella sp. DAU334]
MPIIFRTVVAFMLFALPLNHSALAQELAGFDNKLTAATNKTVIIVRHAEKLPDGTRDPLLSQAGHLRAQALATKLTALAVTQAIASNYQRTQLTLQPLAKRNNIAVSIVSTTEGIEQHITQIAALVNRHNGNSVIAGHSNTVPMIITALGGPEVAPIAETDFGDYYQLTIGNAGKVSFTKEHFGI